MHFLASSISWQSTDFHIPLLEAFILRFLQLWVVCYDNLNSLWTYSQLENSLQVSDIFICPALLCGPWLQALWVRLLTKCARKCFIETRTCLHNIPETVMLASCSRRSLPSFNFLSPFHHPFVPSNRPLWYNSHNSSTIAGHNNLFFLPPLWLWLSFYCSEDLKLWIKNSSKSRTRRSSSTLEPQRPSHR